MSAMDGPMWQWFIDMPSAYLTLAHRNTVSEMLREAVWREMPWAVLEDACATGPLGDMWLVAKSPVGSYAGTFPKRLAKWLRAQAQRSELLRCREPFCPWDGEGPPCVHAAHSIDATKIAATCAQIGAVLGPAVNSSRRLYCELRRQMNWKAGDFGDGGSCFWGGRREARTYLGNDAGFRALCFYNEAGEGLGRVLTIRRKDRVAIFNAYGVALVTAARVLSQVLGLTYSAVNVRNNGSEDDAEILYLNGGNGYLLHPYGSTPPATFDLGIEIERGEKCPVCEEYTDGNCDCIVCENCGSDATECDCCLCENCEQYDCDCERCRHCDSFDCSACGECNQQQCRCTCCRECEVNNWCDDCDRCRLCGGLKSEMARNAA